MSKAFKRGLVIAKQHLQTTQVEQTSLQEYLQAGYQVAVEQCDRRASQNKFMLGWWYQGYPFFGLMRAKR